MSGDENKLKKYRFPETLTNQSRWFGLPLDELIPAAICIGWGITTSKYLFGIGAAVLVYFGIKKLKKGRGSSWLRDLIYPDQFLPLQRDMIGKFGAAKDQWFSSFLLQVENHSSWHRLFVDPLSRAMYSSDGPDFEFVQQKRKEGLSIHEAVWQLAWKKSGPEMASLEAWLEEHEKYRSVA